MLFHIFELIRNIKLMINNFKTRKRKSELRKIYPAIKRDDIVVFRPSRAPTIEITGKVISSVFTDFIDGYVTHVCWHSHTDVPRLYTTKAQKDAVNNLISKNIRRGYTTLILRDAVDLDYTEKRVNREINDLTNL